MNVGNQQALFALLVLGYGTSAMANLTFSGTLNAPPPCTINSGNTIDIDFQEVGVSKVDGVNYLKPVNYIITCSAGTLPWEMVLTVKGVATSFESSALQSSVSDLGIRLLQNGEPLPLNTLLVINPSTPPVLEAVPIKRPGVSLGAGAFTSSATLLAQFQ
ncbi:fimbrial protein [Pseudomonas sp. CCC3.1]|uniref:fimbrial protein n=1 Tax=Pseudomonas sp. CCC3.1 TaxID=3048607 RepID=UPI002AC93C94|nr:fimbrial protein [Pseudomonas sp. CCC3.1]MEB0205514.1 fimbrial protein [Pseudomonas sp. CCC3.1]WPX35331.1 fimbrial protein [Pseudomonas sp. CCC3.1]